MTEAHPTLRHLFAKTDDGWKQRVSQSPLMLNLIHSSENDVRDVQTLIETMNVINGPLIGLSVSFNRRRLLIVIHHLIVDGVSWRLITSGIVSALQQQPQILERHSFQEWIDEMAKDTHQLPIHDGMPTYGESIRVAVTRPFSTTISETRSIFNTLLHFASSLSMSLFGTSYVNVERHGRESPQRRQDLDVSSTVGWFTSIQPETCQCPEHSSRTLFQKGILCIPSTVQGLPLISINFHGLISMFSSRVDVFSHEILVHPEFPRSHLLDFDVWIANGLLHVVIWVAPHCLDSIHITPQQLGENILIALTSYMKQRQRPTTQNQEHLLIAMDGHPEIYDLTICYEIQEPQFTPH